MCFDSRSFKKNFLNGDSADVELHFDIKSDKDILVTLLSCDFEPSEVPSNS